MKKIKEYYICDRCNKELSKADVVFVFESRYQYDLCIECANVFEEYKEKYGILEEKAKRLQQEYNFGSYLAEKNKMEEW